MAVQDPNPLESEILREVAAEMKEEQLKAFWKKYGTFFVVLIVVALVCAGGFEFHRHYTEKRAAAEAAELQSALTLAQDGENRAAADAFRKLRDESTSGYRYLAALHYVRQMLQNNDYAEAMNGLDVLIKDGKTPPPLRDLALFNKVSIAVDQPDADYDALEKELQPMIAANNAWTPDALELSALIALQQKNPDKAKSFLQQIISMPNVSDGLRRRATDNLALLDKSAAE
ncbi:MAG: tetratricopeptide repeat protein [Alphaproteobacteria bacterium]